MYTLTDIFKGNYPVSQTFGARPDYYSQFYIYGVRQKGHEGVDFATPVGVDILAPFNGRILRVGYQPDFPGYGNVVVLWDPIQRCAVWFIHLSTYSVSVGQSILKGKVMGKTGNTGNSTGAHLHFGIVETDANGNRLHKYDGYGGFINPLGGAVQWVLGTPPIDEYVLRWDKLKISVDRLKSETDTLNSNPDKKAAYEATMAKIRKIADTGSL